MMTASQVFMVEPLGFDFNGQTAADNVFQNAPAAEASKVKQLVLDESHSLRDALIEKGIKVCYATQGAFCDGVDGVFPNNWVSFHEDGELILYPMATENRRLERDPSELLRTLGRNPATPLIDLSIHERKGRYLEGTGSMVLDRVRKNAYACASNRTNPQMVQLFCDRMDYQPILFHAGSTNAQGKHLPVYHTNVVMSLGRNVAVICLEALRNTHEREFVTAALLNSDYAILAISLEQMFQFAANILLLKNERSQYYWVMSDSAYRSFNQEQIELLQTDGAFIVVPIPTIERIGGGSVRCMLCEVW